MSPDTLFSIASMIAFLGWLALILLPKPWRYRVPIALCAPALAVLYAVLIFPVLKGMDPAAFSTLDGVMSLQGSELAALVGWVHYLAFDLIVGWVIANDADLLRINRWLVVPALLLTFMLGPVGWLIYLLIRVASKRGYVVRWQ
ncbi:MAG: ABA4-like family protein [Saprospiraceae bacterium]